MKLLKHTLIGLFFFTVIGIVSCGNDDCDIPMVIADASGLDGCQFVLTLDLDDVSRTLEPINLSDFDIQPVGGLEVCGEFIVRPDLASTCQVGEIVELTSLSLR